MLATGGVVIEEDGLFSRSLLTKSGFMKTPMVTHFLKDFKIFFPHTLHLRLDQPIFLEKTFNSHHPQYDAKHLASRMREVGGGHPPPNIKIGLSTCSINEQHLLLISKIYDGTFCCSMLQYSCKLCNSFNGILYHYFSHSSSVELGLLN